ncbi:MAG TPA: ASCH domain-containing protein [bacterium]|nr:ASCH domain-containing protein [bacterium]
MNQRTPIDEFWDLYLQSLPPAQSQNKRYFEAFCFGNKERLANLCADLVVRRIKTATSALLWEHEATGKPVVQVGDLSIVTSWNGAPVCIIETLDVRMVPFDEVDEGFVYDYGEGDRSMEWWRTDMWEYYSEECRSLRRAPTSNMCVVCERFRVIFPETVSTPRSRTGRSS